MSDVITLESQRYNQIINPLCVNCFDLGTNHIDGHCLFAPTQYDYFIGACADQFILMIEIEERHHCKEPVSVEFKQHSIHPNQFTVVFRSRWTTTDGRKEIKTMVFGMTKGDEKHVHLNKQVITWVTRLTTIRSLIQVTKNKSFWVPAARSRSDG